MAKMRIKKLELSNFKRFEELTIDLYGFNCLVGPNNSGKTTLLQALALFDFCAHLCLERKNGHYRLQPRSIGPDEFHVLALADFHDLWTDRVQRKQGKTLEITIGVEFAGGESAAALIKLNYNRLGISIEASDTANGFLAALNDLRISYFPVFSALLPREERRMPAVIEDELARGRVNTVIRNLLFDLKREGREGQLAAVLSRAFPELERLRIEFDEVNDRYINVSYREQGRPKEFDLFSSGSGFQQFVYLFGFILLRQPSVILLDEPDVHLHGSLQGALVEELDALVHEGKQVLVATHSRDLISHATARDVVYLDDGHAQRLDIKFDMYDALATLGSLELDQIPLIQRYQRVLIVENRNDYRLLSAFCATVLGGDVWRQVERRLAVCYAFGNPVRQDIERLRKQLQQLVGLSSLEAFIVADRDYHPDRDALLDRVGGRHLVWHVWERTEVENYLLSIDAFRRHFGFDERQTSLIEMGFEAEFGRLLKESRDLANDRLVKAFEEYGRQKKEGWDSVTHSRLAREYLRDHWNDEQLALADAKEIVLPGINRWLQEQGLPPLAARQVAQLLEKEDLPEEVHLLARRLREFVGI